MANEEPLAPSPETSWKDVPRLIAWIAVVVLVLWFVFGVLVPRVVYPPSESVSPAAANVYAEARQVEDVQGPRGQFGDQFGLVNSLFTGLALGAVALSVFMQRRESRRLGHQLREERGRHEAQEALQRKEHSQSLYTAKLQALVEHYRVFREEPHYRRARSLAWRCTHRALREAEFRQHLGVRHSAIHRFSSNFASGHFKDEWILSARDQTNHVYSWDDATHYLDDLLSFFSVFSLHIKAVEQTLPANDGSKESEQAAAEFKAIVHQLNIYWDWWSVCARYVDRLQRKADEASSADLAAVSTPKYDVEFDRLDRYMFRGKFSTRLPEPPCTPEEEAKTLAAPDIRQLLKLLNEMNKYEVTWRACHASGDEPTQTTSMKPDAPVDFTFRDIGVW